MTVHELLEELQALAQDGHGDDFISAEDGGGLRWAIKGVKIGRNSMYDSTVYVTHYKNEEKECDNKMNFDQIREETRHMQKFKQNSNRK